MIVANIIDRHNSSANRANSASNAFTAITVQEGVPQ